MVFLFTWRPWPLTHRLRDEFSPDCVLEAADVAVAHAAFFAAASYAWGFDTELVDMLVFGAQSVGEIDPSGVWPKYSSLRGGTARPSRAVQPLFFPSIQVSPDTAQKGSVRVYPGADTYERSLVAPPIST